MSSFLLLSINNQLLLIGSCFEFALGEERSVQKKENLNAVLTLDLLTVFVPFIIFFNLMGKINHCFPHFVGEFQLVPTINDGE